MPRFSDIIDQEQLKNHMQNALETGKVSHAYIISGEDGSGKEFVAKAYAKALLCESREKEGRYIEACDKCHSCIQAESGTNPDIITLVHEKPNVISVDDIRTQIRDSVIIKPYAAKYKVYIIPDGEMMNVQAQNALLKTLEEPPAYVVIIILTNNADAFLQTIISRCVVLPMKPASDDSIRKYLMEDMKIVSYKADLCTSFARGNVGKAIELASSDRFEGLKNNVIEVVSKLKGREIYQINQKIQEIIKCKNEDATAAESKKEALQNQGDMLDVLLFFFRDILVYKSTEKAEHLIFQDKLSYIRDISLNSSYEGIKNIFEALDRAQKRITYNVNADLTLQMLFLDIKENI
ncbi:MAG: DNA polymerase III subunit delta [Butyrivibrio sp.]|nr:DNA polymerase III subunit delta [Butyrivibrio sp.]